MTELIRVYSKLGHIEKKIGFWSFGGSAYEDQMIWLRAGSWGETACEIRHSPIFLPSASRFRSHYLPSTAIIESALMA